MKEKYRLTIIWSWYIGKYKQNSVDSVFVWDDKNDALECKRLIEKAAYNSSRIDVKFEAFGEAEVL